MALKRLWTALCGATNEATEAVADTQAIRILDQEIREAKSAITESGHGLTKIAAKRKLSENKIASFNTDIEKYTLAARQHAETDRELALECAQKVADLTAEQDSEKSIYASFTKSEETLKQNIKVAKQNLRRLEQQVDQVKATESVQKAQVAASTTYTGGNAKMKTAMDSLDRIQAKQQERSAELDAAEEIANDESGASLESRLASAGRPSSSEDALAAILAK
jgi:phage shock protein A